MMKKHAYIKNGEITGENENFYKEAGYLIAENLISESEILELRSETNKIFRGACGVVEGLLPITAGMKDNEILKKYVAIHFPHKISAIIYKYLSHPKVTRILSKVIGANVKCMQSMLFVKSAGKSGQSWHQDEYFIPTRDCSLTGAWIAIDDATVENGCLWIIPGSNQPSLIYPRVKNTDANFADVDTIDVSKYSKEEIIPVVVKSGSVVFFNGYTLHSSLKNTTKNQSRIALVNHYMSAESMLPWDQDGKLNKTQDLRDIVLVHGEDPYKQKGIIDVNRPYLRSEILNSKK